MHETDPYISLITTFGLKEKEARIYLACLRLGQATVGAISEAAGVQRTFVYELLDELAEKGLVSTVEIRGKKTFSALSIERFKDLQAKKLARLETALPELKALQTLVGDRPRVRFFEGKEGIFAAQRETLEMPRGSEILAYATVEGLYHQDPEFALSQIRDRVKKGIRARALAADTPEMRETYISQDAKHLRTTRLVPIDRFPFSNEINIWGNKVSIMSMQGELLAVVIESESVAQTQRSIFELAWEGAGNYL